MGDCGHGCSLLMSFNKTSGADPCRWLLVISNGDNRVKTNAPRVTGQVVDEHSFTPTALAYLADISQVFAQDRGLLMGLYSVMLGIDQLVGAVAGGLVAQLAYFDGLVYLTVILACIAMGPLIVTMIVHRAPGDGWCPRRQKAHPAQRGQSAQTHIYPPQATHRYDGARSIAC